uniref:F-box domain-containing protein n=1 Tax=Globodera pallida TaxID=36090 RepID=A0A183BVE6_GLOPA
MSDNTSDEEQQQQMQEISICADIWLDVFALLSPLELGLKMALISDRFDRLVDEHFKTRKWSLGWIGLRRATEGNAALIVSDRTVGLPIPQIAIRGKVINFKNIEISYIDRSAIEFLQRLRRLFDFSGTTVAIATSDDQNRSWDIIRQEIWPLINDNIRHLRVHASQLDRLRQLSPTILHSCAKLQSIDGLFPVFPADDNANASSNQAVAKWLLTRRGDDLPKLLHCNYSGGGMEELTRAFVNDSKRANFIICLTPYILGHVRWAAFWAMTVPLFELTNNFTRERLTFRREGWPWLLVRCPIERDEDQWAVWEREAIELQGSRQWNCITIHFNDMDIGDGMLDANDGRPQ